MEVGKDGKSPPFNLILESLYASGDYLAFAPDTSETRMMIDLLSVKFPLLKVCIGILCISFCLCLLYIVCDIYVHAFNPADFKTLQR